MLAALLATSALLAQPFPQTIPVPPGSQPEGVAAGPGRIGYVGSRADGSVYRFNVRTGEGRVLVSGREGRGAFGLKRFGRRLYVAGGPTGFLYVYNARTGRPVDAVDVDGAFVNDVTVTRRAAYFTDSQKAVLYVYPRGAAGIRRCSTSPATGSSRRASTPTASPRRPTAAGSSWSRATPASCSRPTRGRATPTRSTSATTPSRTATASCWRGAGSTSCATRTTEIAVVRLNRAMTSGRIVRRLTDDDFDTPTTAARIAGRLYAVNARFSVEEPDEDTTYDVVRVG